MPFVETTTGRTHYLVADGDTGDAPDRIPAILVHGSGGIAEVWAPVMAMFGSIRAIAVDMPGHGESEGALAASVADAAAFIEDFRGWAIPEQPK